MRSLALVAVLAVVVGACGFVPPTLATYDMVGCYLMGIDGRLEMGGPTGSQVFVAGDGTSIGGPVQPGVEHAVPLVWPAGTSARLDGWSAAIVGRGGNVIAHAGDQVSLGGGFGEGGFWACDS